MHGCYRRYQGARAGGRNTLDYTEGHGLILAIDRRIDRIWAFDKREGFRGLWRMAGELRKERFDYVYDAHSNIRSNILKIRLRNCISGRPSMVLRSKERWKRFLLFRLGINRFPQPFRGMVSFRKPLERWGIGTFPDTYREWRFPEDFNGRLSPLIGPDTVTLVASANWEMKRWPVGHWRRLIELLPEMRFLILAGPQDAFCEEIRKAAPERTVNLAGKTSLLESCYIVYRSKVVVSADTGFMHAADLFGIPAFALMGQTAFGYPTGRSVRLLECDLPCRPCTKDGRGKCRQEVYQKCLVDITPDTVASRIAQLLS